MINPVETIAELRQLAPPAQTLHCKLSEGASSCPHATISAGLDMSPVVSKVTEMWPPGKIGSSAPSGQSEIAQEKQAFTPKPPQAPQCAAPTPTSAPNHEASDHKNIKIVSVNNLTGRPGRKSAAGISIVHPLERKPALPTRRPRHRSACVENFIRKRWRDTSGIEKFSAAASHTAVAGGLAFSLNLGLERESMLLSVEDPRTRMRKNIDKHLRAAGLEHLPLAWLFEVGPDKGGNRLHLHGVVDPGQLSDPDLCRLEAALIKAAGLATHAIGGDRQLDIRPLYYAAGWVDYLLKSTRRTANLLRLEPGDLFVCNHPMIRRAQASYELARVTAKNKIAGPRTTAAIR